MRIGRRYLIGIGVAVAAAAFGIAYCRPDVAQVEVATVGRGALRGTIDEDGIVRVRHHTEVTAPVAGRVAETPLRAGDSVTRGMVVARLYPAPLDQRMRADATAALRAATAVRQEAEALVRQAEVAVGEARRARARAEQLAAAGALPPRELEHAVAEAGIRERELEAAAARARAAAQEERRARTALLGADPSAAARRAPVEVRSPIGGLVLRVFEEHDRVVPAGTPLLEIADPRDVEIVIDVLTRDAVEIAPGAEILVRVGDRSPCVARVRRVEPSAFTKVSPLGVEEQRVNVIGEPVASLIGLGDRFEVDASIVLWEASDVTKVPLSALVPSEDGWSVFVLSGGRARLRAVEIGRRGAREVEVLSGLAAGDTVIVHPDERLRDGHRARAASPR